MKQSMSRHKILTGEGYTKLRECGSLCQLGFLLFAVVAGATLVTVWIMLNIKYSLQAEQQPLVIELVSFSVSDINISTNSFSSANWDATLIFTNKHKVFVITMETFQSYIYRENSKVAVSCALVEGMQLKPDEEKQVQIKFNQSGCLGGHEQSIYGYRVTRDGYNVRSLNVELGFHMKVAYKRGLWSWVYDLKPSCGVTNMNFVPDSGRGNMSGGDQHRLCTVPVLK